MARRPNLIYSPESRQHCPDWATNWPRIFGFRSRLRIEEWTRRQAARAAGSGEPRAGYEPFLRLFSDW